MTTNRATDTDRTIYVNLRFRQQFDDDLTTLTYTSLILFHINFLVSRHSTTFSIAR